VLKRSYTGEVRNVPLPVATGTKAVIGRFLICEGTKEDKAGWSSFLKRLNELWAPSGRRQVAV
jgi:putative transposase